MTPLYHPGQPLPKTSGIYRITCTVTGKFYIGSAINLKKRFSSHLRALHRQDHRNSHLQAAWNKYGEASFVFEVIELVLPTFQLEREQYWIDKLKPWSPNGFNMTRAANSTMGREISQATREKLRVAQLGKPAHNKGRKATQAQREKMSLAQKMSPKRGEYWTGRKHSPETRAKLSEVAKNRPPVSAETREKLSLAGAGKKRTDESRERYRAARLSRTHPSSSYDHLRKTLIVTSPHGTEYMVHGVTKFCKEHHLHQSSLMQVANGNRETYKGWTARYPETNVN